MMEPREQYQEGYQPSYAAENARLDMGRSS